MSPNGLLYTGMEVRQPAAVGKFSTPEQLRYYLRNLVAELEGYLGCWVAHTQCHSNTRRTRDGDENICSVLNVPRWPTMLLKGLSKLPFERPPDEFPGPLDASQEFLTVSETRCHGRACYG
jgi:hypothetical protein